MKVNELIVEYSLIEDQNYMVYVDDPGTQSTPSMTMKDTWGAAVHLITSAQTQCQRANSKTRVKRVEITLNIDN